MVISKEMHCLSGFHLKCSEYSHCVMEWKGHKICVRCCGFFFMLEVMSWGTLTKLRSFPGSFLLFIYKWGNSNTYFKRFLGILSERTYLKDDARLQIIYYIYNIHKHTHIHTHTEDTIAFIYLTEHKPNCCLNTGSVSFLS